jgi:transcriptional regulator with XRE-family HTH domain
MSTESVWRNLIVGYRKKHALTQADAAARFNVSQQTISRWESGKQEPDPDAQTVLRQELGILAFTMREAWIQRVSMSAGREYLFERGWRFIAVSGKISQAEVFIDPQFLGKPLNGVPFFADIAHSLNVTGLFDGTARLVRLRADFDLDNRSVGRVFDLWPVLTGTDEILVHAIGYPCAASSRVSGHTGARVLDCTVFPTHEPHETHRRSA